ncbi:hypothetical protein AB0D57_31945 [Streptomyces sp. NPDC048275]|uniref:hypothetical protein n=1 Tax=Streptomyces sp. NPDC048275 TaxID=3155629 RepID=UPI0033E94A18
MNTLSGQSRMRKRVLRPLVAGAAVMAGLALTAGPASAADGWQSTNDVAGDPPSEVVCTSDMRIGRACFQPYGEWLWLKDSKTNGEPVAMEWKLFAGQDREGVAYWAGGSAAGWTNLNKSFPDTDDGTPNIVSFRVCEVDVPSQTIVEDTCSARVSSIA